MVRNSYLKIVGTLALVLTFVLPLSARQKQIRWDIILGEDACHDKKPVLYLPTEVVGDSNRNIYVLQRESVEAFDSKGKHVLSIALKKGKGPGEFAGPASLARDEKGNLYVWDEYLTRISKFDPSGKLIDAFKVGSLFKKMALSKKGEFLFLGLQEGNVFHLYSKAGKKVKSFGEPFNPVPDVPVFATSPTEWFVHGDTIWVANPLQYEIRQYVSDKLISTVKGPDQFPKPRIRESGGSVGVGISRGIFGLASCNGRIVATVMQPSGVASLDIFSLGNGTLLSRIECLPRVRSSGNNGQLYFVDEGKVRIGRIE